MKMLNVQQNKITKLALVLCMICILTPVFSQESEFTYSIDKRLSASIIIDSRIDDWRNLDYYTIDRKRFYTAMDDNQLAFFIYTNIDETYSIYIDSDMDSTTGYQSSNWSASGFEYMLTQNSLYMYNETTVSWDTAGSINSAIDGNYREYSIPLTSLNLSQPTDMRMALESSEGIYYPAVNEDILPIDNYITGISPLLMPPASINVSVENTTITITWDPVTGASGYEVYYNDEIYNINSETSIIIENPDYITEYSLQVRTTGTEEVSCWSGVINAKLFDSEAPGIPQNPVIDKTGTTYDKIKIQWDESVDNIETAGYIIYRDSEKQACVTSTSYEDTTVSPGTAYSYTIAAYDPAGNISSLSTPLDVTIEEEPVSETIILENNTDDIIDTFLSSANPDTNYGSTSYLSSFDHFAIKFNIPDEITGSEIIEAKICFYVWNQTNYQPDQYLDLYLIDRSWEEDSATWNNADSTDLWNTPGGDYYSLVGSIPHMEGSENWDHAFYPELDVTSAVQDWVDNTVENNGFMLVNDSATGIGLKASEYSEGKRPYLKITYTFEEDTEPPAQCEDLQAIAESESVINLSWSASSDNKGVAGYNITRNNEQIAQVTQPVYRDTGLAPGTEYTYIVTAYDDAGNVSANSTPAVTSTFAEPIETTIHLEINDTEVVDAFLVSGSPDTNYGSTNYLSSFEHFAVKFNFPPELYNKTITDAKIAFYVWNQSNYQPDQYLDLYIIDTPWDESSATWNNSDSLNEWNTPGGDYGNLTASILHLEGSEYWDHAFYPETDVTAAVQQWLSCNTANNGFMLVNDSATSIGLKASEYSAGKRTYLDITYSYYEIDDTQPPAIPQNLTGTPVSGTQVNLTWDESTDNYLVSGYIVYRDDVEISITDSASFTDTGLEPGTAYTYTVKAFDYNGNVSDASDMISITTQNQEQNYYTLSITAGNGDVNISPDQQEYEQGTIVTLTAEPYTNYEFSSWSGDLISTDNPVTITMDRNKSITAEFSAIEDTVPPSIPLDLESVQVSHNSASIRWSASQDNDSVAGYNIYRDDTLITTVNTVTYYDTDLTPLTIYQYRVSAFDPSGNESDFSDILVITTTEQTASQAIIIDHNTCDITAIPQTAIENAKTNLIIAYGHTSHGSQVTTGMSGLVSFMNGIGYPADLYAYNSTGSDGALQLRDTPFSGASDLGNPDRTSWADATRTYLNANTDVNVVMWSWCGQVSSASESDIDTYLSLMTQLEQDFPQVSFVYMTGHLDGSGETGNLNLRNQQIRDYCTANNKILYDFADIESYDPDGNTNYMLLDANDNCEYDSNGDGTRDTNWASEWQSSHTEDTDWYTCSSAHSQPLNANLKAYAAWYLFSRIAGWTP